MSFSSGVTRGATPNHSPSLSPSLHDLHEHLAHQTRTPLIQTTARAAALSSPAIL